MFLVGNVAAPENTFENILFQISGAVCGESPVAQTIGKIEKCFAENKKDQQYSVLQSFFWGAQKGII